MAWTAWRAARTSLEEEYKQKIRDILALAPFVALFWIISKVLSSVKILGFSTIQLTDEDVS